VPRLNYTVFFSVFGVNPSTNRLRLDEVIPAPLKCTYFEVWAEGEFLADAAFVTHSKPVFSTVLHRSFVPDLLEESAHGFGITYEHSARVVVVFDTGCVYHGDVTIVIDCITRVNVKVLY
jgi:hypothetical protein